MEADWPLQMVALLRLSAGTALTTTVLLAVDVHPLLLATVTE